MRKVSVEPSGSHGPIASLSAGQSERHSVLEPASLFPFSQKALSHKPGEQGQKFAKITPMPLERRCHLLLLSPLVIRNVLHGRNFHFFLQDLLHLLLSFCILNDTGLNVSDE